MENERKVLPSEIEVIFDYDVSIKNEMVPSIVIKKPKMHQVMAAEKITGSAMDREMWIISALTGATVNDLKELDIDQYALLQEAWGKYASPRGGNA